jgi:endonuclease/exonuclease/phosphatase family metal-dependent hydrolase
MKRLLAAITLALLATLPVSAQETALRVMTFNLRLSTAKDGTNAWQNRKDKVAAEVLFHQVHLLGVQEALWDQQEDLQAAMPHYKWAGVGRADGKIKGEFSAIFYDTNRVELLQTQTFWLSETPNEPGRLGWDAACPRVVTWGRFKDKVTGKEFYHFNTHFDHLGKTARRESARFLLQQVEKIAGRTPAVITGDFNAVPEDEPIRLLLDEANPLHFTDSKAVSQTPHYGPDGTFNGFRVGETSDKPIDYIFLKGKFRVLQHGSISQTWKGLFASDHFAVLARLAIE